MAYLDDYLLAISLGFTSGMLLGGVSTAWGIIRRSFKQTLNMAD